MLGWLMGRRLVEEHCFDDNNILLRREDVPCTWRNTAGYEGVIGMERESESQKYVIPLSRYPLIKREIYKI